MELVAVDLGGTHARFAIARLDATGDWSLTHETVLRTADHPGFEQAWAAFALACGRALPNAASIAVAAPADAEVIQLTNNAWTLDRGALRTALGLDEVTIVNDFAAVAYSIDRLGPADLVHLCGPDAPLPDRGPISVIGPGTGLGVALLVRDGLTGHVIPTEGGHTDFAPVDPIDDAILAHLRTRHRRVSVERVVAGPGLAAIHAVLARLEGMAVPAIEDRALWTLALAGTDALARATLDRFCMALGSAAGDVALAHGARAVVVAGGLGLRLAERLPRSGFRDRFVAKGRFESLMDRLPVKMLTHTQPGLLGAAAAFAASKA